MREYETIYVLRPDMSEQEEAAIHGRLAEVITRQSAHLLKQAIWGKRKLAYDIGNFSKGVYVSLKYLAEAQTVQELERNLKILEPVIRFGTFRVGEVDDIQERIARQAKEDEDEAARRAAGQKQQEAAADEADGGEGPAEGSSAPAAEAGEGKETEAAAAAGSETEE